MDTKFSKGEWGACCLKSKPHFVFAGEAKTICAIRHNDPKENNYESYEDIVTVEESVANAKLIQAAPSLFYALKDIIEKYIDSADPITQIEVNNKLVQNAINAIKKVTE